VLRFRQSLIASFPRTRSGSRFLAKSDNTRVAQGAILPKKSLPEKSSITLRQFISEQPPGSWVAISADQTCVVSLGRSREETSLSAKGQGYREMILLRVPDNNAALDSEQQAQSSGMAARELISLIDELRSRAQTMRTCLHCGSKLVHVDTAFWLSGANRSWNIPLPVCPKCQDGLENVRSLSRKVS
jgi:hypothetical protein